MKNKLIYIFASSILLQLIIFALALTLQLKLDSDNKDILIISFYIPLIILQLISAIGMLYVFMHIRKLGTQAPLFKLITTTSIGLVSSASLLFFAISCLSNFTIFESLVNYLNWIFISFALFNSCSFAFTVYVLKTTKDEYII